MLQQCAVVVIAVTRAIGYVGGVLCEAEAGLKTPGYREGNLFPCVGWDCLSNSYNMLLLGQVTRRHLISSREGQEGEQRQGNANPMVWRIVSLIFMLTVLTALGK